EHKKGQRIIKTISIRPHLSTILCPVTSLCALRDHPAAKTSPRKLYLSKLNNPPIPSK
ncbi:hypothetical protein CLU79DRAFT_856632, partial [Phycomyces nitens]